MGIFVRYLELSFVRKCRRIRIFRRRISICWWVPRLSKSKEKVLFHKNLSQGNVSKGELFRKTFELK
jgi:hypothetical protein